MAPLWKQKKKESNAMVDSRARSAAERDRAALLGLNDKFEFDKWLTKPYEQSANALGKELDEEAGAEGEEADAEGSVSTTRLPVAELQKLMVPVSSVPAKALRSFHANVADISALAAHHATRAALRISPA